MPRLREQHVKGEYADCVIGMITADYMPDAKAKILKREAHIPLDLKRKLSSAVPGKIRDGAIPPYQTGGISPSPETGGCRPLVKNSTCAAPGFTRNLESQRTRAGTRLR